MILERSEKYAKEIDDVMVLIVDFVKKIRAGESVTVAALEEVQNALNAVAGINDIPAEMAANLEVCLRTVSARAGELAAALINPILPVVPAPAPLPPAV